MKPENRSVTQRRLPMLNWMLAFAGIAMTAYIHQASFKYGIMPGFLIMASGPYLLLGTGCHISRQTPSARRLGLYLSLILLIVPACLYFFALILRTDAQSGLALLSVPFWMWIYSSVSFCVLLDRRPRAIARKTAAESPCDEATEP